MSFDPNAAAAADSGIFGLPCTEADANVILIPVPFAATVSYGGGAERGPAAILAASRQVDLYDLQYGRIYEHGIFLQPADPAIAAAHERARPLVERVLAEPDSLAQVGAEIDAAGALVNERVRQAVARVLAAGKIPGVVGGDHSVPLGAMAAIGAVHPEFGVLHFDAHADLRVAYEGFRYSHASIMDNVCREVPAMRRLVQVGIRDFCEQELLAGQESGGRIVTHFDAEWQRQRFLGTSFDALCQEAIAPLPRHVYVSFDIDGLDPALCPGTGTPVPGGLQFAEAVHLLHALVASGRKVVGFDLVEVAPNGRDEWDANVGARMLYKLCAAALQSR
jgi:agmatinase